MQGEEVDIARIIDKQGEEVGVGREGFSQWGIRALAQVVPADALKRQVNPVPNCGPVRASCLVDRSLATDWVAGKGDHTAHGVADSGELFLLGDRNFREVRSGESSSIRMWVSPNRSIERTLRRLTCDEDISQPLKCSD